MCTAAFSSRTARWPPPGSGTLSCIKHLPLAGGLTNPCLARPRLPGPRSSPRPLDSSLTQHPGCPLRWPSPCAQLGGSWGFGDTRDPSPRARKRTGSGHPGHKEQKSHASKPSFIVW